MKKIVKLAGVFLSGAGLGACGNSDMGYLVFGQQHTVGLTISGSTTDQGAELTLGYKDRDIAVMPIVTKNADGHYELITSSEMGEKVPEIDTKYGKSVLINEDSMSVFGQFSLEAGTSSKSSKDNTLPGPSVGLGKFFATGFAARRLAEGFAAKLAGQGQSQSQDQDDGQN